MIEKIMIRKKRKGREGNVKDDVITEMKELNYNHSS